MFIRKKKNISGSVSVQVLRKVNGKNKLLFSAGSSFDKVEISELVIKAKSWINTQLSYQLDFDNIEDLYSKLIDNIVSIRPIGSSQILDFIYDEIGFNLIKDGLFKVLVLGRILYPVSKLKLTEYLARYEHYFVEEDTIYRYLDKITDKYKRIVQQISYTHTKSILGDAPKVVFYDVTTLYFEIEQNDELRQTGFSKDGKHQHPQIVLGLLVSKGGYPLGYEIFKGNKYEGQTMMPILNYFKRAYKLKEIVVVADSGLMNKKNIQDLNANNYSYIIGARIKNETEKIKNQILSFKLNDNQYEEVQTRDNRLIIGYSISRAKKDAHNRERGISKLEKEIKSGNLKKENLNNKGYKKFLNIEIDGNATIKIDYSKIEEDKKWDGLKGYNTNTKLTKAEIVANYNELWVIEKAFRINKNDIKIRPIYHRLPKRIEAHICICFTAYKILKELERQLKEKKVGISTEKMLEIAQSINQIEYKIPSTKEIKKKILYLTEEHQIIKKWLENRFG